MNSGRAVGLLLGVAADAAFGDPERGHPVASFGRVAGCVEKLVYRDSRAAGIAFTTALVGGTIALGGAVEKLCCRGSVSRAATTAVATWAVLGGRSLAAEGTSMALALDADRIESARNRLSSLCGRRAEELGAPELARATVESVAENTSDAVVAPLLWGALCGVPGLVAYRAVNTLDAMVGNRSERYARFGWASARLDDAANLLPARIAAVLTVVCASPAGGSAGGAWRVWQRDASAHPSPNAGRIESAFAGALGVWLGGPLDYGHSEEMRPVLGQGEDADAGTVRRSVSLSRGITLLGGCLAAATAFALRGRSIPARGRF